MLMEKLEAVHNSKQMYKEKWAMLVRDVQKVRFENGSVSSEHSKYETSAIDRHGMIFILQFSLAFSE